MEKKNKWGLSDPVIDKSKSKNGKFVAYYYYWKEDGTRGHSNTRSFTTEKRALSFAQERQDEKCRKAKELRTDLSKKTIEDAMDDYIADLEEKLKIQTTDKASRFKDYLDDMKAMKKHHTPAYLLHRKLYDIEEDDFKEWAKHIDTKDIKDSLTGLSGSRVWSYRKTLGQFLDFLSKNDYFAFDRKMGTKLKNAMYEYKLKDKKTGKKEDTYVPTYEDISIIGYNIDRSNFSGEYDYVLIKFLFYSGLRICEAIALRWCDVDFDRGLIYVNNSINQKEKRDNAMRRLRKNIYKAKNETSIRCIPMMEVYYKMFKNYKYNYMKHFNLSDRDIDSAFCFPKLQSKEREGRDKGPYVYQTQKWIGQETSRLCDDAGIDNFPPESLRHACARFIANDLRILESEAYDLFGHTDNKMLKEVYANLRAEEKALRIARRQPGLFYRNEEYEQQLKEKQKERLKEFEKGQKLEGIQFQADFRATRDKIQHLIDQGRTYYTYTADEEKVITRLVNQFHFDETMTFIKEEN